MVPRIALRLTTRIPAGLAGNIFEKVAANASHAAFYALMTFMPASGIAMGYYGGKGLPFFGYTIPGALLRGARARSVLVRAYSRLPIPLRNSCTAPLMPVRVHTRASRGSVALFSARPFGAAGARQHASGRHNSTAEHEPQPFSFSYKDRAAARRQLQSAFRRCCTVRCGVPALEHVALRCNTLCILVHCVVTRCTALQPATVRCNTLRCVGTRFISLKHVITRNATLRCNLVRCVATRLHCAATLRATYSLRRKRVVCRCDSSRHCAPCDSATHSLTHHSLRRCSRPV